ncbi:NFX1-type zinc finger-containing protein 1-like [Haliotis asinina]|uniref:NFX1-type zinc finger-containing protein 1-like n=1 Tax=Haliotis asinina TaxID=109174 RepID=UPI0035326685
MERETGDAITDGRCVAAQPDKGGGTCEDKNQSVRRAEGDLNERGRQFDRTGTWSGEAGIQRHAGFKDLELHRDNHTGRGNTECKSLSDWRDRDSRSPHSNQNGFKKTPLDGNTGKVGGNYVRANNWRVRQYQGADTEQDVGFKKLDRPTDGNQGTVDSTSTDNWRDRCPGGPNKMQHIGFKTREVNSDGNSQQGPVDATSTDNWRNRCPGGLNNKKHIGFKTREANSDGNSQQGPVDATSTDNWRNRCPGGPNNKKHIGFKTREANSDGNSQQGPADATSTDNWRDRCPGGPNNKKHIGFKTREANSDGNSQQGPVDATSTDNWRDRCPGGPNNKKHIGFKTREANSDGNSQQGPADATSTDNWRDRCPGGPNNKQHIGFKTREGNSDGNSQQGPVDATSTDNWRDRCPGRPNNQQHIGFEPRETNSDGHSQQGPVDSARTRNWRDRCPEGPNIKQHIGFKAREVHSCGQARQYTPGSTRTGNGRDRCSEGVDMKGEIPTDREKGQREKNVKGTSIQRYENSAGLVLSQLKELTDKDPSTILLLLNSRIHSLMDRPTLQPDAVYTFVSLIAQGIQCRTESSNVSKLLLAVHESNFYEHVSHILVLLDTHLTEEDKSRCFLKDLTTILCELYIRLPHAFMKVKVLGLEEQLILVTQKLQGKSNIVDDEIVSNLSELQKMKYSALQKSVTVKKEDIEREPPDDFRALSILPSTSDIYGKEEIFLRKNKTIGGYKNLDHYLDVQFRLLKEDFVGPLRDGIGAVAGNTKLKQGQRINDVRAYHGVQICSKVYSASGILHRLHFDVNGLQEMVWEDSKNLIYGSLVCLLPDNFETFILATITDRDSKLLRSGIVDVSIEFGQIGYDKKYTMVETTAFFEAYRHVLKALQEIQEGELPFEKYIIHCDTSQDSPRHLTRCTGSSLYDLQSLRVKALSEHMDNFPYESATVVNILKDEDWPTADTLLLNPPQYESLRKALTKEFSIIQGPPGTGKTFIGLKIAKALLRNSHQWKKPMLIVCYTNHALDQFLEGIISFQREGVIRVGSRISKECLEDYSLNVIRLKERSKNMKRVRWERRKAIEWFQVVLEDAYVKLKNARETVLHEDILCPYMHMSYDKLLNGMKSKLTDLELELGHEVELPACVMQEWLGVGKIEATAHLPHDVFSAEGKMDKKDVSEDGNAADETEKTEIYETGGFANIGPSFEESSKDNHQKDNNVPFGTSERKSSSASNVTIYGFQFLKCKRKNVKQRILGQLRSSERMAEDEAERTGEPWSLSMRDRWRLYRYWVFTFCERLERRIRIYEEWYNNDLTELKELQEEEDSQLLQDASVIGMTTTAAARHRRMLAKIGPRIIIVEEAAEVLEGHIISTLSKKCEHLILIGDHKQLRPNPTVYNLAKRYHLDLSLFERMVSNGIHCDTLSLQHRMRPEISSLLRHIYPKLEDHPSVFDYENVKGISTNMFFIDHRNQEETDEHMISHSNEYEAVYVVALCSYLLKQGYDHSQITVLTTYAGQQHKIRKLMRKGNFPDVKLTVVDNYQGEENDIVLLSLVRSNPEGSVGFLKIENRICVALSRARMGLFVIGNFEMLATQSLLWKDILEDLNKKKQVGPILHLYCQNHQGGTGIRVKCPNDFKKAPDGGCLKPCAFKLKCGHVCSKYCHPYDPEHKEYLCMRSCTKILCSKGHPCPQPCHEKCGPCVVPLQKIVPSCGHEQIVPCFQDPNTFSCINVCEKLCSKGHSCPRLCHEKCEPCVVPVQKIIPSCGHEQTVPCFQDPQEFPCHANCETRLDCGHICGEACGKAHRCTTTIKKTFRCGHEKEVLCINKDTEECNVRCGETLDCGHSCEGNCYRCHEGRLHVPCQKMCKEILICGHDCGSKCSHCPPCRMACENRCPHKRCPKFCGEICEPCSAPCEWKCEHFKCTSLCYEPCNRPPCNEPCKKKLPCEHQCIGLCGEPCPKQCRFCNAAVVSSVSGKPNARFIFLEDCGHIVEITSLDRLMESTSDQIKLKECPQCKTVIRYNMRYGNVINSILRKVDVVKRQCNGQAEMVLDTEERMMIEVLKDEECEGNTKEMMLRQGFTNTVAGLTALQNQFTLLDELTKITDEYDRFVGLEGVADCIDLTIKETELFRKWLLIRRQAFSRQEESDAQKELLRHKMIIHMLDLEFLLGAKSKDSDIHGYMLILKDILVSGKSYSGEKQLRVERIFDRLWGIVNINFSEEIDNTKVMITPTTGIASGHWLSCCHGHVYSIGESRYGSKRFCPRCNQKASQNILKMN